MFDDVGTTAGGGEGAVSDDERNRSSSDWREIDRQLRCISRRRGELDAEELRWLSRAARVELHRELGMATMLEYVERVLGYGPKTAKERLRVARKLEVLPRMAAALDVGTLPYSAVRELSRFVKPATEEEWLEITRGKCLREIEEMSSGRKPGDRPTDPVDPDLRLRPITLELTPPTLALFREACRRLEDEMGHPLTDDEMMVALCSTVLDPAPRGAGASASHDSGSGSDSDSDSSSDSNAAAVADSAPGHNTGKRTSRVAPYQIALVACEFCDRAWHDACGRSIEVPPSILEMARCDAQYIGRVDGDSPERAYQEIPPATARMVLRRDHGRCRVPGCRSSRFIHIHHIIAREHGGSNDPSNLVCLCFAHHHALHLGKISLTGAAPDALLFDLNRFGPSPDSKLGDTPRGDQRGEVMQASREEDSSTNQSKHLAHEAAADRHTDCHAEG